MRLDAWFTVVSVSRASRFTRSRADSARFPPVSIPVGSIASLSPAIRRILVETGSTPSRCRDRVKEIEDEDVFGFRRGDHGNISQRRVI
jgi:hypothetical protein